MKPKILCILHLPPPVHGAALMGNYVKNSDTINNNFECRFISLSTAKTFHSIGKLGIKKMFFFFQLLLSAIKALVKKNYDICYVTISNGRAFYKDFFVIAVLKIFRKKILLHFHNKGVAEATQANKINRYLYQFVLGGKKTRVILLSPFLYYDVRQYVEPSRIYYCANGIPNNPGYLFAAKKIAGPVRLLFLSNMMEAKGVFVLLAACAQLKKQNIAFECHFVGDWYDITETFFHHKVAALNLSGVVFAYGKKYGPEKNSFYQQSDIFVFPSLHEAFGLVLLEAMQFELPVVASDEGGMPGIVLDNETGYIVVKNDPGQLACKLLSLIRNPALRKTMGLAGKKRFEENFTLNKFEERLTTIINEFSGAA